MSSKSKYKKSLLAVALSMVTVPSVYAADQTKGANYDRIAGETVVITAARTQKQLLDTDASVAVVTGKETQLLNRDSVPDLLSTQSSLNIVSDGTPGAKRVAIRGEHSSRTLVMVNGDRISDQKTKSGAPMLMNPYFIDRIEVVKGPASVLYGSDAIGGIVNVITKQASANPIDVEAGVGYNSATSSFTEFMNATGTVDRFKYAVGAFNENAGDLRIADGRYVDNTAYRAHGFNADLSYDVTDKLTLGYNGELYISSSEVSTTTDYPAYQDFRGSMPKWNRMKHKLYFKAVDLNDYVAAVDGSFYYQTNDKDYLNTPYPGVDIIDVSNEQESFGANLQAEFSLSDTFYLVTGYEGRLDKAKAYSFMDLDMITLETMLPPNVKPSPFKRMIHNFDDAGFKQQNHAIYSMLSTYITDDLTLNTGIRYNYVKNDAGTTTMSGTYFPKQGIPGMPPMPPSFPAPVKITAHDDQTDSKLLGSVGLVYRPFENGAFRANWSQGFRSPTLQELFITTSTGEMQYGNPDLKPEESDNFELGFRWDDGSLAADFAVFYTIADNYIETQKVTGTDPITGRDGTYFTFQNIAQATTYGSDLSLAYLIDGTYEPYVNLTYLVREYEIEGKSSKNNGTPRWSGNAGLRYYGSTFNVDGYAKFADNSKNDDIAESSYIGAYNLAGFVTWNLAVSAHFGSNDQFTAYAALENIFDKKYMTNELIHDAGRSFSLGVRGKF